MRVIRRRNQKGFTLLEIIFALAILVIGVVGALVIFPVGLRASKRGGDFTMAAILAQRQMATVRRDGYSSTFANTDYENEREVSGDPDYPDPPFENAFPAPDDNFAFSVVETAAIDPLTGITIANLNQVTVEIYWLDRGVVRSEQFVTYLANHN